MVTTFVFVIGISFYYGQDLISYADFQHFIIPGRLLGYNWDISSSIKQIFSDGLGIVFPSLVVMRLGFLEKMVMYKVLLVVCMFFYSMSSFVICRIAKKLGANNLLSFVLGIAVPLLSPVAFSDISGEPVIMLLVWIFISLLIDFMAYKTNKAKTICLSVLSFLSVLILALDVRTYVVYIPFLALVIAYYVKKKINTSQFIVSVAAQLCTMGLSVWVWSFICKAFDLTVKDLYTMPGTFISLYVRLESSISRMIHKPYYFLGMIDTFFSSFWYIEVLTLGLFALLFVKIFVNKPKTRNIYFNQIKKATSFITVSFAIYLVINSLINARYAYAMHFETISMDQHIFTLMDVYFLVGPVILFATLLLANKVKISNFDLLISCGAFLLSAVIIVISYVNKTLDFGYKNVCRWFGNRAPVIFVLASDLSKKDAIALFVVIPVIVAIFAILFKYRNNWKTIVIYLLVIGMFQSINFVSYNGTIWEEFIPVSEYSNSFCKIYSDKKELKEIVDEYGMFYIGMGDEARAFQYYVEFPVRNTFPVGNNFIAISVEPYQRIVTNEVYEDFYLLNLDENETLIVSGDAYANVLKQAGLDLVRVSDEPRPEVIVDMMYYTVLGRHVDDGAAADMISMLDDGTFSFPDFLIILMYSIENFKADGQHNEAMLNTFIEEFIGDSADPLLKEKLYDAVVQRRDYMVLINYLSDHGVSEQVNEKYNVNWR